MVCIIPTLISYSFGRYTVCITHAKALSVSTCSHWDCAFSCWSCCHPHSAAAAKNPWKYKKSPSTLSSCCKKSKKIYIHWKAAAKKYTNPRKYKKSPSALSSCCKKIHGNTKIQNHWVSVAVVAHNYKSNWIGFNTSDLAWILFNCNLVDFKYFPLL